MPSIKQKFISREDLRANPSALYLFGDNEQRQGSAGQAKEMRGEPNAIGIRVKRAPGKQPGDYWTDKRYDKYVEMIRADMQPVFEHVANGGLIVLPLDGIGTGLSELDQRAPQLFSLLSAWLDLAANFNIRSPLESRRDERLNTVEAR